MTDGVLPVSETLLNLNKCTAYLLILQHVAVFAEVHDVGPSFAGKVHVCGFEQEHIPDLAPLMQAGVKVPINLLTVAIGKNLALLDLCLRRSTRR